jgi:membrane-bound ClpP family serine protease
MLQNVCLAQASARGEYVEKDSPVVVIAVTGNQIIVRKKDD